MRLLLDTQLYLWFIVDSPKLSKRARDTIARANDVYVSATSIWEMSIKKALGKLESLVRTKQISFGLSTQADLSSYRFWQGTRHSSHHSHRITATRLIEC